MQSVQTGDEAATRGLWGIWAGLVSVVPPLELSSSACMRSVR